LGGGYKGTIDFDPGNGVQNRTAGSNNAEGYVVKLNASGNLVWSKTFISPGQFESRVFELEVDSRGNLVLGGEFNGSVDLDPGTSTSTFSTNPSSATNPFIVKLDTSGTFIWGKQINSTATMALGGLALDYLDEVYLTGTFSYQTDFDPGPGSVIINPQFAEFFVLNLNAKGKFNWVKNTLSPTQESGEFIHVDEDRNIYTTGFFERTVDFDPGPGLASLTSVDLFDGFIHKMKTRCTAAYHTSDTLQVSLCGGGGSGYTSPSGRFTWTSSGQYHDTIPNEVGCDSLLTIFLRVGSHSSATVTTSACESLTSPSGRQVWRQSGTYTDTLANAFGCDSIITFQLTIYPQSRGSLLLSACDSFRSPSQKYNWRVSGQYTDTVQNVWGCDSIIDVNLTVGYTSYSYFNYFACDSFVSPSKKYVWRHNGLFTDTISNRSGCDSVVRVNLTLGTSQIDTLRVSTCGSYTSPSQNYRWTQSGTYRDTLTNQTGCDSVFVIELDVGRPTAAVISEDACGSYTSPSQKYTWIQSGTYRDTITNRSGCDSIIVINLTVNQVDTLVTRNLNTLTAQATNATFQWIYCDSLAISGATSASFSPAQNGRYAVIVNQGGCIDTSRCWNINSVSLGDHDVDEGIDLFPNPTRGLLFIELGRVYEGIDVSVFDPMGRLIEYKSSEKEKQLSVSLDGSPGIYLIQIKTQSGRSMLAKVLKL
jgi:hypothetical protein